MENTEIATPTPEPETETEAETDPEPEADPEAEPEPETETEAEPEPASGDAHVSRDNAMGSRTDDGHNSGATKVGQASSGARKL